MIDYKRLVEAHTAHRKVLESPRKFRQAAIRRMVGKHYSEAEGVGQPIPMVEIGSMAYRMFLASECPQAMFSIDDDAERPAAYDLQQAVNRYARKEINLAPVHERWVVDAVLGCNSVVKCGITVESQELMGLRWDVGRTYVDNVSLDDYSFDTAALKVGDRHFTGNHYSIARDRFAASGLVPRETLKRVKPVERTGYNEGGDERAEQTTGNESDRWRLRVYDMLELWEFYLPQKQEIVVFQADASLQITDMQPLMRFPYVGPYCGPYHDLILESVPDSPIGLPPVALWTDMHESLNRSYRKMIRQIERYKKFGAFRGQNLKDGKQTIEVADGEMRHFEEPDKVKEMELGGVSPVFFNAVQALKQDANYVTGNPNVLMGLDPTVESGKQYDMMRKSSSGRIEDAQRKVQEATQQLLWSIGWHLHDELTQQPPISISGPAGLTLSAFYTPDRRGNDLMDAITVTVHSLQNKSPSEKRAVADGLFDRIVKNAQVNPQSGAVPNITGYIKLVAELEGFERLNELVTFASDPAANQSQGGPTMNPETTRTYERISRSAPSPDDAMMPMTEGAA